MRRSFFRFFWLLLLVAQPVLAAPPWLGGESRPEDLNVFLVTFGPGSDVPSWFGHGALGVRDNRLGQVRLYNYGMFSFDEAMLAKFAMGRLEFWVGEASAPNTYAYYKSLDRDVRIQELAFEPAAAAKVAKALAENVLPKNRNYLYHHYDDNCSTRLRDMVDLGVNGQLHEKLATPARMTLRGHTRRYAGVFAPMSLLLDFLMNDEIDQPISRWEESFLPRELELQLADFQMKLPDGTSRPLVSKAWTYYKSTSRTPILEAPPRYEPWLIPLGLALGLLPLLILRGEDTRRQSRRWLLGAYNAAVGVLFGIPGLALLIMWVLTDHTVTHRNENLLLANPLTFLALPLGIALMRDSPKSRRRLGWIWMCLAATSVLAIALKVFPMFDQNNVRMMVLIGPLNAGMAVAFWLDEKRRAR